MRCYLAFIVGLAIGGGVTASFADLKANARGERLASPEYVYALTLAEEAARNVALAEAIDALLPTKTSEIEWRRSALDGTIRVEQWFPCSPCSTWTFVDAIDGDVPEGKRVPGTAIFHGVDVVSGLGFAPHYRTAHVVAFPRGYVR